MSRGKHPFSAEASALQPGNASDTIPADTATPSTATASALLLVR